MNDEQEQARSTVPTGLRDVVGGRIGNGAAGMRFNRVACGSDLILTMSGKLEALIKAEIGDDNGREMPEVAKIIWTIDRPDL